MNVAPVLEVDRVGVSFSGRKILDDVSFEVREGEFTGLIGSNGVGKTTLLRVILGSQRTETGTVRLGGSAHGQTWPIPRVRPPKGLARPRRAHAST